ncbi:hypothetical protein EYF80_005134 [Liparis tanakae]|uniref:Uncharacterized protein n=1 Tax=Liparis tanakae TaxID=230148 RepID=A0A4Z2J3B7_9TELE|nr:hypothetical protein EYF80_005134 [Liparis tanakae]
MQITKNRAPVTQISGSWQDSSRGRCTQTEGLRVHGESSLTLSKHVLYGETTGLGTCEGPRGAAFSVTPVCDEDLFEDLTQGKRRRVKDVSRQPNAWRKQQMCERTAKLGPVLLEARQNKQSKFLHACTQR